MNNPFYPQVKKAIICPKCCGGSPSTPMILSLSHHVLECPVCGATLSIHDACMMASHGKLDMVNAKPGEFAVAPGDNVMPSAEERKWPMTDYTMDWNLAVVFCPWKKPIEIGLMEALLPHEGVRWHEIAAGITPRRLFSDRLKISISGDNATSIMWARAVLWSCADSPESGLKSLNPSTVSNLTRKQRGILVYSSSFSKPDAFVSSKCGWEPGIYKRTSYDPNDEEIARLKNIYESHLQDFMVWIQFTASWDEAFIRPSPREEDSNIVHRRHFTQPMTVSDWKAIDTPQEFCPKSGIHQSMMEEVDQHQRMLNRAIAAKADSLVEYSKMTNSQLIELRRQAIYSLKKASRELISNRKKVMARVYNPNTGKTEEIAI